jgi:hypothetical protein
MIYCNCIYFKIKNIMILSKTTPYLSSVELSTSDHFFML